MTDTKARVPVLTDYWTVKGDPEARRFPTTLNGEIEARVRELWPTEEAMIGAFQSVSVYETLRLADFYAKRETGNLPLYRLYEYKPEYRRIRDVIADLNACLKGLGIEIDEYGWNVDPAFQDTYDYNAGGYTGDGWLWPENHQWIACYAVTGGNEGHYMHLEVIHKGGSRTMIALAKTFQGMEFSYDVCKATAMILEA